MNTVNIFVFFLADNQTVFVYTDVFNNEHYYCDTIYTPTLKEIEHLTKSNYSSSNESKYFKKVEKIVEKLNKKGNIKDRENIVLIRDSCKILLFNINKRNLEELLNYLEEFKTLPSSRDKMKVK